MKDDDSHRREADVVPFPSPSRSDLADEVAGLSRRLDTFTVEMRQGLKDILTVLRLDRGARSDLDERANQLERDVIEHRQRLGQLEQAAQKRAKKARTK